MHIDQSGIRETFAGGKAKEKRTSLSFDPNDLLHGNPRVRGAPYYRGGGFTRRCRNPMQREVQTSVSAGQALPHIEGIYQGAKNKKRRRFRDKERQSAGQIEYLE